MLKKKKGLLKKVLILLVSFSLTTNNLLCSLAFASQHYQAISISQSTPLTNHSPLQRLQQNVKEIKSILEEIQNKIAKSEDTSYELEQIKIKSEEIEQLNKNVNDDLERIENTLSTLKNQGVISEEKLILHRNFVTKYLGSIGSLKADFDSLREITNNQQLKTSVQKILQNIDQLSPNEESKVKILGNEKLPHRISKIPHCKPSEVPAIITGLSLPTQTDLEPTVDVQITEEIKALAKELEYDPAKIFMYVRNNIDYEPYFGSVKGSQETLFEHAGNDFDQASLLMALLRASNVPSRYIAGVGELPIEKVMNWVGVQDKNVAVDVFYSNGIPSLAITSADGTPIKLKFYHVWVETYIPHSNKGKGSQWKEWVMIDPSFKQYEYTEGIDLNEAMGFDLDSFIEGAKSGAIINEAESYFTNLNSTFIEKQMDEFTQRLFAYVQSNMPNATIGNVIGTKKIKPIERVELNSLAQSFPFKVFTSQYEFSEISDALRYKIGFQLNGIDYPANTPEIAGKKISIHYIPATPEDQAIIDYFGGIYNTPAYLVNMKPLLKIDGSVVSEGLGSMLGSYQILYSNFLRPSGTEIDSCSKYLTVGADYAVVLDIQRVSVDIIKKRIKELEDESAGYNPDDPLPQQILEKLLHVTGMSYFAEVDALSDVGARISSKVIWTREPSEAVVAQDLSVWYWAGIPYFVTKGGMNIDVLKNTINPISITGSRQNEVGFMLTSGSLGSGAEHGIFEQLYGIESISTIKILTLASQNNIPIYYINSSNINQILPQLNTFSIVKQSIIEAVNMGWVVIVPKQNIQLNDWYGAGWIIMDPTSGSAGYLIAGYLTTSGVVSTLSGGSTSQPDEIKSIEEMASLMLLVDKYVEFPLLKLIMVPGGFLTVGAVLIAAEIYMISEGGAIIAEAGIVGGIVAGLTGGVLILAGIGLIGISGFIYGVLSTGEFWKSSMRRRKEEFCYS